MNKSPYLTTEEVAEYFRTTPATVRHWRSTQRIKGTRIGKRVLYTLDEVRAVEKDAAAAAQ